MRVASTTALTQRVVASTTTSVLGEVVAKVVGVTTTDLWVVGSFGGWSGATRSSTVLELLERHAWVVADGEAQIAGE